jgi:branched-chain amino acid transport system substrate-binding protein
MTAVSLRRSIYLCVSLCLFLSCAPRPVRVGFIAPMTGASANIGVEGYKGFSLALAELEEGGPRWRFEATLKDDAGDPQACLAAAQELYADGVRVIILHTTSGAAAGALPWLLERDVIVLTRAVSASSWVGRDDNFIRFIGSAAQFGQGLGRYAARRGALRMATVLDRRNAAYASDILGGLEAALEEAGSGAAVIAEIEAGDGMDHDELARWILLSGADAAAAVLAGLDAAKLAQALDRVGFKGDLYLAPWSQDHNLLSYAGSMTDRIFLANSFNPSDRSPRYRAFVESFRSVFGEEPVMSSLYGYEIAYFLSQGLAAAKDMSPRAVKAALLERDGFNGLQQRVKLDEFGDLEMDIMIITIKAGRFEAAP